MAGDAGPREVEWLTAEPARRSRSRRHGLWWSCLAVLAALLVSWTLWRSGPDGQSAPPPLPRPPAGSPSPTGPPSPLPPPIVTAVEPNLLGVRDTWELHGRSATEVVRVQLAAGRVIRTPVPRLQTTGPVSFRVAAGTALIRPLDDVPGHAVPAGRAAQSLVGALNHGGLILPGPTTGTVWHLTDRGDISIGLNLVEVAPSEPSGGRVRRIVRLSRSLLEGVAPDGTGSIAYRQSGRLFVHAGPQDRPLVGQKLLATGRRAWLVSECPDEQDRCRPTLVDRADGTRRILPVRVDNSWMSGAMSPDGRYVALLERRGGHQGLRLLDLRRERAERLPVSVAAASYLGALAWSPDGRYLFVLHDGGSLLAYEPRRGDLTRLDVDLPPLEQITVTR